MTAVFAADAHAVTNVVDAIDSVTFIADNDDANAGAESFSFEVSGQTVLTMNSDDTTASAQDNYTIQLDVDNGGAGVFSVQDFNGGGATVTTLSMDADTTTIDSNSIVFGSAQTGNVQIKGTLDMTQSNVNNVQDLEVEGNQTIAGTLGVNGNVTLGDANGDSVTVNGSLDMTQGNVSNVQDLEVEGNTTLGDAAGDSTNVRGTFSVRNADANIFTVNETTGTAALGTTAGGAPTSGTLNISSSTVANTIQMAGSSGTITAGTTGQTGTMAVRNTANELTVNLLGAGSSVIADGLTVGSAGTASAVDGHLMIVDAASARFESDNAQNSVVVNNTSTTISNTAGAANSIVVAADAVQAIGANNFTYGTRVNGGMFVDGDLGVNGNIYTLNNAANATVQVANNGLDITGATNTVGLTADNDALASNARARLELAPTTASLLVNTDSGVGHGISITQSNTVISGGTNSTTLTLDDSGATFQNTSTGGPARVTGVADGTSDFDAVNYRQLRGFADTAYSGIATAHALSAIPSPAPGKSFAVGGGYGYFEDKHAFALGGSAIVTENIVIKGGWGYSNESSSANGGVAYSF